MRFVRLALASSVVLLAVTGAAAQSGGLTVLVADDQGLQLRGALVTIGHATG